MQFKLEKHGKGPEHYSGKIGETVFEIYPCQNEEEGKTRLGFSLSSLESVLVTLKERNIKIVSDLHDSPWGIRAVIEDPDGNKVELTQKKVTNSCLA